MCAAAVVAGAVAAALHHIWPSWKWHAKWKKKNDFILFKSTLKNLMNKWNWNGLNLLFTICTILARSQFHLAFTRSLIRLWCFGCPYFLSFSLSHSSFIAHSIHLHTAAFYNVNRRIFIRFEMWFHSQKHFYIKESIA